MHTISSIKQLNKANGFHFFDRKTMRFFASKIESHLSYGNDKTGYFITSEKTGFESTERVYTIREVNFLTGDCHTLKSIEGNAKFKVLAEAKAKIKLLVTRDANLWLASHT